MKQQIQILLLALKVYFMNVNQTWRQSYYYAEYMIKGYKKKENK